MARARNIKPGFFTNEYLSDLQPLARLLFIGLWCYADREGRLEDRPRRLKTDILPYDNCDVEKLLNTLVESPERFIIRYEVDGKRYIQISNFLKHQNPHIKEPESIIPAPCENCTSTELASEPSNQESVIGNQESGKGNPQESPPYKEVIDYLNAKAGTKYRHTGTATQTLIRARATEGFEIGDFKRVIDNKCVEWLHTEQEQYLRPETLFCAKHFESYLNQKNKPPGKNKPPQAANFDQRKYTDADFEKLYKDV